MADQPRDERHDHPDVAHPDVGHPDVDQLGYEEAREELLTVVRTLEQGGVTLEESLALWERGERLAQRCQEWLDGARTRLDEVLARRDG